MTMDDALGFFEVVTEEGDVCEVGCRVCGGLLHRLGILGRTLWLRCQDCGAEEEH